MSPAPRFVGMEVKRLEDPRLLRGQAQYVDDLTLPGLAAAHVLRSRHAHARVVAIDTAAAEKLPGVWAVLAPDPLRATHHGRLPDSAGLVLDADRLHDQVTDRAVSGR